ncbi:MAG: hypothetical protein ACI9C2_001198 [Gammaproteobacteria bacterium]
MNSRDGVNPDSVPPARTDRPGLEARLLPLLTEHMARLTIAIEAIRRQGAASASGLDELTEEIDQLGWALGVTCAGAGADVLMERSRADGLAILFGLVAELRGMAPSQVSLPKLLTPCPWDFPLVLARLLWWGSDPAAVPGICRVGETWVITGKWGPDAGVFPNGADQGWVHTRLILSSNGTWHLEVPVTWMHS